MSNDQIRETRRFVVAFPGKVGIITLIEPGHLGSSGNWVLHSRTERMVLVKKLIALILVAGFLVISTVGCSGGATTKPGSSSTGTKETK